MRIPFALRLINSCLSHKFLGVLRKFNTQEEWKFSKSICLFRQVFPRISEEESNDHHGNESKPRYNLLDPPLNKFVRSFSTTLSCSKFIDFIGRILEKLMLRKAGVEKLVFMTQLSSHAAFNFTIRKEELHHGNAIDSDLSLLSFDASFSSQRNSFELQFHQLFRWQCWKLKQ